jgi:hypothetical protein
VSWLAREMESIVHAEGGVLRRLFYFYAACPKCVKLFGKNQVVLFAQIE